MCAEAFAAYLFRKVLRRVHTFYDTKASALAIRAVNVFCIRSGATFPASEFQF